MRERLRNVVYRGILENGQQVIRKWKLEKKQEGGSNVRKEIKQFLVDISKAIRFVRLHQLLIKLIS